MAARDDVCLIPVVDVDVAAERFEIANRPDDPGRLTFVRLDNLPPIRFDEPRRRATLVVLTRIAIEPVEIELRPDEIPFGVRHRIRSSARLPARARTLGTPSPGCAAGRCPRTLHRRLNGAA